ncbi:MAG: hypothetical protein LBF97_01780 [Elusimicrobiota bacterium]|jgi:RecA/RadA recombinase|nr:hypothetical protein [Elusimicrobiota bacterium]
MAKKKVSENLSELDSIIESEFNELQDISTGTELEPTYYIDTGSYALNYAITKNLRKGIPGQRISSFFGLSGSGKCFAENTEVMMADGSCRKVQDVKENEYVMGWDSTPRKVTGVTNGKEEMFKITFNKNVKPLIVNKSHILTITGSTKRNIGKVIDISLVDFLKEEKKYKRDFCFFKMPVKFEEQKIELDPYFLGLWLGDGTSRETSITTQDNEIIDYCRFIANKYNLGINIFPYDKKNKKNKLVRFKKNKKEDEIKKYLSEEEIDIFFNIIKKFNLKIDYTNAHIFNEKSEKNEIYKLLEKLNLLGKDKKHIPDVYLKNSENVRLNLLAGLIDTDGYLNNKVSKEKYISQSFEITTKYENMAEEIVFLARSLGFTSTYTKTIKTIKSLNFSGEYYRIYISGEIYRIPTKLKRKQAIKSNIKAWNHYCVKDITSVGEGNYYGFCIEGDGRFLLYDFMVVHNTMFLCQLMRDPQIDQVIIINSEAGGINQDTLKWVKVPPDKKVRYQFIGTFTNYKINKENGNIEEVKDSELPKNKDTEKYLYKVGLIYFLKTLLYQLEYKKISSKVLIIIDSMANIKSVRELGGTSDMGMRGKNLNDLFSSISGLIENTNATLVFSNKQYVSMNPYDPFIQSGGLSVIYNPSVSIELKVVNSDDSNLTEAQIKEEKLRRISSLGMTQKPIRATIKKSRAGTQDRNAFLLIDSTYGAVQSSGIFTLLQDFEIIQKNGSRYLIESIEEFKSFYKKDFVEIFLKDKEKFIDLFQKLLEEKEKIIEESKFKTQYADYSDLLDDTENEYSADGIDADKMLEQMEKDKE